MEINPKLRICKGSNTWYQSSIPWSFAALLQPPIIFIHLPSNSHNYCDHRRLRRHLH
ncbi:hypothetical protein GW17_00057817 [Ensete ventricosum]|nr:hypothetical protein GW17_00057817 [Ensete ventricosum]